MQLHFLLFSLLGTCYCLLARINLSENSCENDKIEHYLCEFVTGKNTRFTATHIGLQLRYILIKAYLVDVWRRKS